MKPKEDNVKLLIKTDKRELARRMHIALTLPRGRKVVMNIPENLEQYEANLIIAILNERVKASSSREI